MSVAKGGGFCFFLRTSALRSVLAQTVALPAELSPFPSMPSLIPGREDVFIELESQADESAFACDVFSSQIRIAEAQQVVAG